MEWLHCKITGELIEFREQYLIDCGKNVFSEMAGYRGGTDEGVAQFFNEFGAELRSQYPYEAMERTSL